MTHRERYIRTLTFGEPPDRVYYSFGNPRKATMQAWFLQGLPEMPVEHDYDCPMEFMTLTGQDCAEQGLSINLEIMPGFEVAVLETTEHGQIWRDSLGIVMHDAGDKLNTPGFRTRSYISHPVKTHEDWLQMRERYDPNTLGRYPEDWPAIAESHKGHDYPVVLGVPGLFWKARDWMGFEGLCTTFHDDPFLVHEMMEHLTCFIMEVLDRALDEVEVDSVMFSEDMAYKHAAMISPATFREFMLPRYQRLVRFFQDHGIPIIMVDSDGHVGQLLPLWIEAGINGTFPIEIAAHNDPIVYRQLYGKAIAFNGCIDKREIRSKECTFIEVMKKVPWLLEQGGFLPRVDHAVPPDVPLRSYLYMCELIKAVAEGRPVPAPDAHLEIEDTLGPIQCMWSPDLIPDNEA